MSLRRIVPVVVAAALVAGGALFWHFHLFRVEPVGEGYFRSRQPRPRELERTITRYGIRTVINLRGPNPGREWYREEERIARSERVSLVSLPFETFDWPPRIETQRFVRALREAERPVLIHCATGIDRTGWASAVTRLVRGEPLASALQELARARGHVCDIESCPLHQFFELYRGWLTAEGRQHDAATFALWASEIYCPVPYDARIGFIGAPARYASAGSELTIPVMVTNASPAAWSAPLEGDRGIRLGARLLGPVDRMPTALIDLFRAPRAPAHDVFRDRSLVGKWNPGLTRQVKVTFTAPETPGLYLLQIDMVDELVHWFSDLGREGLVVPLVVKARALPSTASAPVELPAQNSL